MGHPLGEGVQDLAQVGRLVHGGDAARLALEEPLGGADEDRLQHARRDRHRALGVADRLDGAGGAAGAPPGGRGRRTAPAGGRRPPLPPGQRAGGPPPRAAARETSGSAAVRRSSATSPPRDRGRGGRPSWCSMRDAELLEEPRRLLAVVVGGAHRADHQPATRAGAGDVEEAALLHQERPGGDGRDEVGVTGAVDPDPVGAQQRRAAAQVGPALLLDVRHDDEVPLEALGPVGGEQPDGRAADPPLGEGVGGQLLGHEAGEEGADADVVALVDGAGGELEERDDRVEVAVGASGTRSALVDLAAEPLRPRGARPQVPEDVLDAGAVGQHLGARGAAGWPGMRRARRRGPPSRRGSRARPPRAAAARGTYGGRSRRAAPSRACGGVARGRAGRRRRGHRAVRGAATRSGRGRGSRASPGRRCRG